MRARVYLNIEFSGRIIKRWNWFLQEHPQNYLAGMSQKFYSSICQAVVIMTLGYLPALKKKKIHESISMHQGFIGNRNTGRGRDNNLQLLRVQENVASKSPRKQGLRCGSPVPEEMEGQTEKEGWLQPKRACPSVLVTELQIMGRGRKARSCLKQDGLVAQSSEGCRFQILSHHRQAVCLWPSYKWMLFTKCWFTLLLFLCVDFAPGYGAEPKRIIIYPFSDYSNTEVRTSVNQGSFYV